MTKKERIEDLGKLSVLLKELFDDDIFQERYWRRPKDSYEAFASLNEEQKDECIGTIAYGIERLRENIAECMQIADGDEE